MIEVDKVHQRVLEIQKTIETSPNENQATMLTELFDIVSQIEQSLAEVKEDINKLENQIDKNEE
jgi:predicted transcriptional regulator